MNYKLELQTIQNQINQAKGMEQSDHALLGMIGSLFGLIEKQLQSTVVELERAEQWRKDHERKHKG